MAVPKKARYFLKSLANGIKVLEAVAGSEKPLSLSEIAYCLGTSKTTATRICYTLSELDLIWRDEHNKYKLTPNVLKFGYAAICSLGWRGVAKFYLEDLAREVQETVNLSILEGPEVLYLLRIKKGDFFPADVRIGSKAPAHCTAMGKVLVAFSPLEKKRRIVKQTKFRPLTVHSIKKREAYMGELDNVKSKGFAINYEELSIGVCGVAAPITNELSEAIAAIGVAVSTSQYNKSDLEKKLAPTVVRAGRRISKALIQMESPDIRMSPL